MKKIIYLVLMFLLIPLVCSEPPMTQEATGRMDVENSKVEYFLQGKNATLYFHAFNSTGHMVDDDSVDCYIYLYNLTTGEQLTYEKLSTTDNRNFQFNLTNKYTAELGDYPYMVKCNNTVEGGFLSSTYKVTTGDTSSTIAGAPLAAIIIIPLVLSIVLLVASSVLGKDHTALKIFLFMLSIPPFFAAMHLGMVVVIRFYNFPQLQQAIGDTTYWMSLIFYTLVVYFMIYFIYKVFEYIGKKQKEKLEY